jgi:alkylation response protein AidB-like acyl-CoA dehydrogenase
VSAAVTLLDAARALAPRIRACAPETEAGRRLPPDLVRDLVAAGFFRMLMPRALGGFEVTPVEYMDVIEQLAWADGAAGWAVLISTSSLTLANARLAHEVALGLWGKDPDLVMAGSAVPRGRGAPAPGGYRLTGRWTMGSGIEHSRWVLAGYVATENGEPRRGPDGRLETRMAVFPASEATIHDTWTSTGLRGTGSHDFSVSDLFVPAERTFSTTGPPARTEPLFRFPFFPQLAHAAHALGIARAAMETFLDLAGAKTPTWSPSRNVLRERAPVQERVARAEALTGSARAYARGLATEVWNTVLAGERPSRDQRARFRLALAHAMSSAVEAVDLLYRTAGASAVYAGTLDRCFRDIHTAAAHVWVAPESYELAGRLLLGLEPETGLI